MIVVLLSALVSVPVLNLNLSCVDRLVVEGVAVRFVQGRPAVELRLAGVDAPEIWRPSCSEEFSRGEEARSLVVSEVEGSGGWVVCEALGVGRFGRVVAVVRPWGSGSTLGDVLVERGLAVRRCYPSLSPLPGWFPRVFRARVAEVVDGDTLWVFLENGVPARARSGGEGSSEGSVWFLPVFPWRGRSVRRCGRYDPGMVTRSDISMTVRRASGVSPFGGVST